MPLVVDEQVALVHVGMEEAVAHGVAEERAQDREAECLEVEAGGIERCAMSEIGMPSIHSTVSTRLAVRFQSTSGTREAVGICA